MNTNDQEIKINQQAVDRLKQKITIKQAQNLRTKAKGDSAMIDEIKKMIEEEVKCCSNQ